MAPDRRGQRRPSPRPWWSHRDQAPSDGGYNPTAALAGFALRYAPAGSPLHDLAKRVAREAFTQLLGSASVEVHELSCFRRLYAGVVPLGLDLGVDLGGVGRALDAQVHAALTRDTALWDTGYVCRPSRFLRTPDDPLFPANADLVREECGFLRRTQLDDGSWPVHWAWDAYPEDWAVAREWWRSAIILENLRFLQAFEGW